MTTDLEKFSLLQTRLLDHALACSAVNVGDGEGVPKPMHDYIAAMEIYQAMAPQGLKLPDDTGAAAFGAKMVAKLAERKRAVEMNDGIGIEVGAKSEAAKIVVAAADRYSKYVVLGSVGVKGVAVDEEMVAAGFSKRIVFNARDAATAEEATALAEKICEATRLVHPIPAK